MPESFDGYYQRILNEEATARWPAPLTEAFEPLSCIASDEKGAIFIVTRKADGIKGILRVSKGEGAEDARAEHGILSRLCDGRIPKALALYEQEGVSYLVREYMEGQTLKEYVGAHGAVSEKELIDIALDICGILSCLHGQTPPVIHRDIKPENIIIAPDGAIKLVDFGIARTHRADATSDTVAVGTRPYMAPEQFGGAQTDRRSDLYALGVVMIYLATLRHDRTNIAQRFPYARLSGVVARLTRADPENRFQSAEELRRALLRARRGGWLPWLKGAGLLLLAGAVALAAALYGQRLGVEMGRRQGEEQGVRAGYGQGVDAGRRQGYDEGLADAEKLRLQGKDILAGSLFSAEDTNGAGNLLLGGIATAQGDTVYFSMGSGIWRQPPDGPMQQFCGHPGKMLQIYEGFLYYIGPDGIYRAPLDGSGCERVVECSADALWLDGGRLYYANQRDKLRLYTAALDGSGHERCGDIIPSSYGTIRDGRLYYCPQNGTGGGRVLTSVPLNGADTETAADPPVGTVMRVGQQANKAKTLSDHDANWLNVAGGRLFYIAYTAEGAALASCDLDGANPRLYDGVLPRLINVSPYGIFYADSIGGGTVRLSLDGQDQHRFPDVRMEHFSVAGGWVYYENRDDRKSLYRMRIDGSDNEKIQEVSP